MQDDVTVHDLNCAIVVAQEGSLSRAATLLRLVCIAAIDAELGARLLD
jgi:hypothetical protein